MIDRRLISILFLYFLLDNVTSEAFQFLRQAKERVKQSIDMNLECLPPSRYYAGSCYTYVKNETASSWERAYNNCLALPMKNDARLLAIESVDEYEFIERELIGLKSGSESVSVYIGLRKINSTWFWSNDVPLKETPVYRFWVDNNRDILAYDCGILWLARNTSVITPAPCVEQALRPYVCKQTIDRCHNASGSCGKYGKCINRPLTNSYQCQCRFFYTGDRCEKWSSQGLQVIVSGVILFIAFVVSYVIEESWSTRKSSSDKSEIVDTLVTKETSRWEVFIPSYRRNSKRIILILLPIIFTIIICFIILYTRDSIRQNLVQSKDLFRFCVLYENNYYHHLLTLPIALVIILLIIFHQTRREYYRSNRDRLKIFIPIPFNPFSKVNRFDTMILSGILSHEILEILEEIFLNATQMKQSTIHGPLFDLVRQIGLIIIISLRYYPIYSVLEMSKTNLLYYVLCSFYMWLDLILRIFQQTFCANVDSWIRVWQKFEAFKEELTAKYQANSSTMYIPEYEDGRSGGVKHRFQKLKDRFSFRGRTSTVSSTTTSIPIPSQVLNWSSIDVNLPRTDSPSTFEQFGITSSVVSVIKYTPYYLCLTYLCCRLTYLVLNHIYRSFLCWKNSTDSVQKHIYDEPTFVARDIPTIEDRYVHHLFHQSTRNPHFHYSKQILNMYMIGFMLIYYLTMNILQNGFNLLEKIYNFTLIPLLILYDELDLPDPRPWNLKYEMMVACFVTAIIYSGQLFFGMRKYRQHMLDAYRGIHLDIPPRSAFRNARLMSKSIHYPGYCIAYLTVGYLLIGNVLLFVLINLRILFKHVFLVEEFAKIFIPILAFYFIKFIIQGFFSRTFFLQRHGETMVLKNLRIYFVFIYFNFFFDCFLGIISCAFRVCKSWLIAFVYLPRLDYCPLGRSLEKADPGFLSYVSFVHMECLHTHPVLIYFCSIVNEQIHRRQQYLRTSKRDTYLYTNHRQIVFRWWLAITLDRNRQLIQYRKQQWNKSFNGFFERERCESNSVSRNHATTCTTLLLDAEEYNDRKPSF